MNLKGKKILVTGGGGSGIGSGICKALSTQGATIILNELRINDAEAAARQYPEAFPIAADISKREEISAMFESIQKEFGSLDGLVNNAGVGLSKLGHEASEEDFGRLYNIDIKGLWQVSKAFVDMLLKANRPGNIVNISSIHARSTLSKYALYSSVKSAVEGLTRGMAVELGPYNIRVNAMGPGYVHSEQSYDLIRTWADDPHLWVKNYIKDHQALCFEILPEDCGNVVAFLLSDLSRSVTGQTIYVDNGSTCLLYNRSFTEKA